MNKNILLIIGLLLLLFGLTKPNLNIFKPDNNKLDTINLIAPTDDVIKKECEEVAQILSNGSANDAIRLRDLYLDLANLIELDGENLVIKDTESIKQANSLAGLMLRLDIKGKYPSLAKETKDIIVSAIGDDSIALSVELRAKAANAFRSLAWACNEGAK